MASNQGPGCYPGCFYYTDSCFRSDCKNPHPSNVRKETEMTMKLNTLSQDAQTEIIEHLMNEGLPEEWATLIAERSNVTLFTMHDPEDCKFNPVQILYRAFLWSETPEGHQFWNDFKDALAEELGIIDTVVGDPQ